VKARGVVFDKFGYKLKLTRLESQCDIALGKGGGDKPSTYSLDIEGSCKIPEDVDGVLITEEMTVLKVLTASGKEMRRPKKARSGRTVSKYRSGTFTPILQLGKTLRVAEIKISKVDLLANPYLIDKLEAGLAIVIANGRTEKSIPAAVSQTLRDLAPGLKARVSSMKISSKRELSAELSCIRQYAGPKGAFIEAVRAIDADGKTIGQARIHNGDPLSQRGKVSADFTLSGKSEPASLVITVVTEAKLQKIPFEITGIFQK